MSVGGKVTEVLDVDKGVWINTVDQGPTYCAIYVERNTDSLQVRAGDTVWWQGSVAYWTKSDESVIERELRRKGGSGVSRPNSGDH